MMEVLAALVSDEDLALGSQEAPVCPHIAGNMVFSGHVDQTTNDLLTFQRPQLLTPSHWPSRLIVNFRSHAVSSCEMHT